MIQLKNKIIVAIDGYSSCGKSSFARLIASQMGYIHLDSGAMYRAVAFFAIGNNLFKEYQFIQAELLKKLPDIQISFKNIEAENHTFLNGKDIEKEIRSVEIASAASTVSKIAGVRKYLVGLQQEMGNEKGIVMDGRDIGTVVFPNAEVKIFMTARMEVRVKRRYDELRNKGITTNYNDVQIDIMTRDKQDTGRAISPLRQAEDAILLDNSFMTFEEQMVWFGQVLADKDLLLQVQL